MRGSLDFIIYGLVIPFVTVFVLLWGGAAALSALNDHKVVYGKALDLTEKANSEALRASESLWLVRDETLPSNGEHGVGTAFKIGAQAVVTAAHVCHAGDYMSATAVTRGEKRHKVSVIVKHPQLDVCILFTETKLEGESLAFDLAQHDTFTMLGFAGAEEKGLLAVTATAKVRPIVFTHVNEYLSFEYKSANLAATGECFRGMSGGPVINKLGGVIGINVMTTVKDNQCLILKSEYFLQWLQGVMKL